MARPFTYVSSKMYYELESYFFKLAVFTDSVEYSELSLKDRNKIDHEINSMDNILHVMRMFRQLPSDEKAIMGWKHRLDHEAEFRRIYRFSSPIVASKCLGFNLSHIGAVCRKERPTAGGYVFQYEEEFEMPVNKKKKWYE